MSRQFHRLSPGCAYGWDGSQSGPWANAFIAIYGMLGTGSVCCRSICVLPLGHFLYQKYLLEGEALFEGGGCSTCVDAMRETLPKTRAIAQTINTCETPSTSHALCDPGGAPAPHRLWPGRECGAAGDQSALQGPGVLLDGNDSQWPYASAGSLQGWTVGRGHDWGIDRHIPDAKLCIRESSSHSSVRRGPET